MNRKSVKSVWLCGNAACISFGKGIQEAVFESSHTLEGEKNWVIRRHWVRAGVDASGTGVP